MRLKLSAENFYKVLVMIALLSGELFPPLISMISAAALMILLGIKYHKISLRELGIATPLIIIFIIGFLGGLFNGRFRDTEELYLLGKDIWYFAKPLIYLSSGMLIFRLGLSLDDFLRLFLYAAIIAAIVHLARVFSFVISAEKEQLILDTIRFKTGPGSLMVPISLAFLGFRFLRRERLGLGYLPGWLIVVILFLSFVLSFSRTLFGALLISLLAFGGYFSFRVRKFANLLLAAILIGISGFLVLKAVNSFSKPDSIAGAMSSKFLNSLKEITFQGKYETNSEKNRNWRGYESHLTWMEIKKGSVVSEIFGNGFGKTVFVGYEGFLGDENVFIPKFHNGFVEIILKTGYAGLLIYFAFYFFAFVKADLKTRKDRGELLLSALLVTMFFSTFVITGIYNKSALDAILLASGYLLERELQS